MQLTIGHLYPEFLNLYGDSGNIAALRRRLEWRGLQAEVREYSLADAIDFSQLDLILIGGGSDRDQQAVGNRLLDWKEGLTGYVEQGGSLIALCGGYPLLGETYRMGEEQLPALGLLQIRTEQGADRLMGKVVLKSDFCSDCIVGFENHGARTEIGNHTPLGRVQYGKGNNGNDHTEGVVYKNVIGTYLHGPLLPANPSLTDFILQRALSHKYGTDAPVLSPLEDKVETEAREYILAKYR